MDQIENIKLKLEKRWEKEMSEDTISWSSSDMFEVTIKQL